MVRATVTELLELVTSVMVCARLVLELSDVVAHAVEADLPHRAILLGPGRDLLKRSRLQRTRPVLRVLATDDQACALQHLDVLGDRRKRHRERLSEFVDGGLTSREAVQDPPPGRV